jgi:hypothetical protein
MDGFSTHQIPLISWVLRTSGPILELGTGFYSTGLLHEISEIQNRKLLSLDSDPSWIINFFKYNTSLHQIELVNDWNDHYFLNNKWSVALVDHAPALQRKETIKQIKDKVEILIIHDSNAPDHVYKYSEIWDLFKYKKEYSEFNPHTMVVSNFTKV